MQDDFISALTREVKEEVIQNYLYERRLIEEQILYAEELAKHATQLQEMLCCRFARMYDLLFEAGFINEFINILGLKEPPFNDRIDKDSKYRKDLRSIKVRGFTDKARFKKLTLEAYQRLVTWNNKYKEAHENLKEECNAVNTTLAKFEKNHDLLTIINFLKSMDVGDIVKKHFMGENFTPEELGAVEKSLHFKPVQIKRFNLIQPPQLPDPDAVQKELGALANDVYAKFSDKTKALIK
ncbi:MAG: hypothetical protein Q7J15_05155 [Candidatus Desulfaltia sp.]|nr:hypothetical protein [Candidatus Desulfaltia sp.]